MEKMKAIAKLKANEERQRLESELELVLIVEKLQELRSMRIQKLKKQEEDNKLLERVRAAVEEEERQATAAADIDAAKGAIATAEEFRKTIETEAPNAKDTGSNGTGATTKDYLTETNNESCSGAAPHLLPILLFLPSFLCKSKEQLLLFATFPKSNAKHRLFPIYHLELND